MDKSKKKYFLLKSKVFLICYVKIIFSTSPLRSCHFCDEFDTLVCKKAMIKAYTFEWSVNGFKIFRWCWTSFPIWRVSNILDLQRVLMFIFNSMIPVANTKLGIEFEYVNMLKIQNVWNWSDNFAFILPQ